MKLDINKNPRSFSALERAIHAHNFICREFDFGDWKVEIPVTKDTNFFGLNWLSGSGHAGYFIEGFMLAAAYCSGSISGGKLRELLDGSDITCDVFRLNSFLQCAMTNQTLWEQNPDKHEEPSDGVTFDGTGDSSSIIQKWIGTKGDHCQWNSNTLTGGKVSSDQFGWMPFRKGDTIIKVKTGYAVIPKVVEVIAQ